MKVFTPADTLGDLGPWVESKQTTQLAQPGSEASRIHSFFPEIKTILPMSVGSRVEGTFGGGSGIS